MGSWGSCNFDDLKRFQRQLEALQKEHKRFCEECAKYLAQRLLANVKLRTPVITGELRGDWTIQIRQEGDSYVIELINSASYAPYVEYGHRTRGHKSWVPGKFMMMIAVREIEEQAPAMIERRLVDLLRRALNAE